MNEPQSEDINRDLFPGGSLGDADGVNFAKLQKWKPLKASHDILRVEDPLIPYDRGMVSSPKKDGNRGLCIEGILYTSSMEQPRNINLLEWLAPLIKKSKEEHIVFDYELFSPSQTHHAETSGMLNSYADPLPDDFGCYVFDAAPFENWKDQCLDMSFRYRIPFYQAQVLSLNVPYIHALPQRPIATPAEAFDLFQQDLRNGDEGSMFRTLDIWWEGSRARGGFYKHGRMSNLMRGIFKAKSYETVDAMIIGIQPRRKLRPEYPREWDEAGHLKRPLTKEAYELTGSVGAFIVRYLQNTPGEGDGDDPIQPAQVLTCQVGFAKGFPLATREVWWQEFQKNPSSFLGRWVEFRHMPYGARSGGVARGGRLVRFRDDLLGDDSSSLLYPEKYGPNASQEAQDALALVIPPISETYLED